MLNPFLDHRSNSNEKVSPENAGVQVLEEEVHDTFEDTKNPFVEGRLQLQNMDFEKKKNIVTSPHAKQNIQIEFKIRPIPSAGTLNKSKFEQGIKRVSARESFEKSIKSIQAYNREFLELHDSRNKDELEKQGVVSDRDEIKIDQRQELDKKMKQTFKIAARYDKKYI